MANPNGAAVKEKPDDLEITSIGSLYSGPWDKKYWSSSRGKDRYPYPIGYGAVRAHNGSTHKMEIQEGPKGPLFSIIAADGQSCSGQTPDIAWEKFQKKCFPRTKIWHGKRFSCKIDGVEFFGFKNPFVQRLLRELAADVNGAAEQSLLPSSSSNGASRTDIDNRSPEAYSDLGRPQITGKRSRKRESGNAKSSSRTGINKTTTEDLVSISEALSPIKGSKRHCNNGNPMPSLNEEHDIPAVLPPLVHLVPVHQEESEISAKDHLPLDSVGFFNHLSKDNIPEDSNGPGKCKATPAAINMSVDERKPVDRSQGTKMEDISFPMATNDQYVDATIPQDCQGLTDVELFAPDTLDFTQDKTADSSSTIQLFAPDTLDSEDKNADSSSTIQDRSTMDVVIADGLTESHPEEETPTVKSNASSQNIDFDSVGQEMAKSMMTFLLPQAIPLLNKGSRKKKGSGIPSEVLPFTVKSQKESNETTAPSPGLMPSNKDAKGKKMHTQSTDIGPIAPTKSIIPDSLDDDQNGDHVSNHLISLSDKAEPDQHNSDGAFPMNSHGHLVSSNEHSHHLAANEHGHLLAANEYNKLIDDQQETRGSKDACPSKEVGMASTGRLQECGQYILESLPVRATPYRKVFSEEITEKFHIDECPVGITLSSKNMNETAVDPTKDTVDDNQRGMLNSLNISEKETAAKTLSTKTENLSFSQVPKLVYTRKKVQTISHMKGNNSGPVSKSIICKNNVPETYPSTETLQVGSSDDNSNIRDSFCAEAKIVGRSSLNAEKPSMNSKAVLNSIGPAVLQDQALLVGEKDTSYFHDLFVSHLENQVDKNVVDHENLLQFKDSETSHKQGPSFSCDPNSIPFGSDLKPHNMELNNGLVGILEFVGCYTHPVPVLSVLLSTKGNHIYICVLCGLLVGKDISLFIYKVDIEEPKVGHPSLVGHTSVTLPDLTDYFGGMALGRSCLQLTPDGQCLVLLDSIKTPFCRQGKTHCLCTTCASSYSEENAVKIVQVKLGYVSLVARLKAVESQRCILVCEPSNLVSVGKTGRLHLWVMDSTWSAQMEYMVMPSEDCISPGIVELKRIPNCTHLIVGHNGYGEFSLWDIFKRILVSRFSVPSASICQFFPISLFAWQMNFPVSSHFDMEEHVNQIMASTSKKQFLSEGEDVAVCLLVSSSDFDAQQDYESGDCHPNPVGRWRLALMVKNTVIFGTALDSRASVIGASAGLGICGTCDGLVYMWELSSGTKLGTMHHFKGGGVSCISTDDSRSGAVAIAGDNQVLVYLRSRKYSVN
ncbi:uncharacterized protein LOC112196523 isoform X3 [Rosa chinensis]|uniref:uncharacterized protein LOC112196523 isoform X3 n=1 Tax=Rosa chinensis TaxID=74649 RepID=UPI000D088CF2|nr:uncharacterized protein LOC112196523 isoform X3 [Rosa chinensis]